MPIFSMVKIILDVNIDIWEVSFCQIIIKKNKFIKNIKFFYYK